MAKRMTFQERAQAISELIKTCARASSADIDNQHFRFQTTNSGNNAILSLAYINSREYYDQIKRQADDLGAKLEGPRGGPYKVIFEWDKPQESVQVVGGVFQSLMGAPQQARTTSPTMTSSSHWQQSAAAPMHPGWVQASQAQQAPPQMPQQQAAVHPTWQALLDEAIKQAHHSFGQFYQAGKLDQFNADLSQIMQTIVSRLQVNGQSIDAQGQTYLHSLLMPNPKMIALGNAVRQILGAPTSSAEQIIQTSFSTPEQDAVLAGRQFAYQQQSQVHQQASVSAVSAKVQPYGQVILMNLSDPQRMNQLGANGYQPYVPGQPQTGLHNNQVRGMVNQLVAGGVQGVPPPPSGQVAVAYAANSLTANRFGDQEKQNQVSQDGSVGGIARPIAYHPKGMPQGMLLAGIPTCTQGGNTPPPLKAQLDDYVNQLYANLGAGNHVVLPVNDPNQLASAFGGAIAKQFTQPAPGYGNQTPQQYLQEKLQQFQQFSQQLQNPQTQAQAVTQLQHQNPQAAALFARGQQVNPMLQQQQSQSVNPFSTQMRR